MVVLSRFMRWRRPDPPVGGLFAEPTRDGAYTVIKVLAVDDAAIHIRIYSNRYASVPSESPSDLEMIGMGSDFADRIMRGERVEAHAGRGIIYVTVCSRPTWARNRRSALEPFDARLSPRASRSTARCGSC